MCVRVYLFFRTSGARLSEPGGLAAGPNGTLFIADTNNNAIRSGCIGCDYVRLLVIRSGCIAWACVRADSLLRWSHTSSCVRPCFSWATWAYLWAGLLHNGEGFILVNHIRWHSCLPAPRCPVRVYKTEAILNPYRRL